MLLTWLLYFFLFLTTAQVENQRKQQKFQVYAVACSSAFYEPEKNNKLIHKLAEKNLVQPEVISMHCFVNLKEIMNHLSILSFLAIL